MISRPVCHHRWEERQALLTHRGLEVVVKWRQRMGLAEDLDAIMQLKPQPRQRALQRLVAKAAEHDRWSQDEGIRTAHEEIDVMSFRPREYYQVKCKREQWPIQADVVREFYCGQQVSATLARVSVIPVPRCAMPYSSSGCL